MNEIYKRVQRGWMELRLNGDKVDGDRVNGDKVNGDRVDGDRVNEWR